MPCFMLHFQTALVLLDLPTNMRIGRDEESWLFVEINWRVVIYENPPEIQATVYICETPTDPALIDAGIAENTVFGPICFGWNISDYAGWSFPG